MHKGFSNLYYFIDKFDPVHLKKINKNISIIYRNYSKKNNEKLIITIKNFCKKNNLKFYLANNIKLALKFRLDGVYLPSFNKDLKHLSYKLKKDFLIIGSAHNLKEIRIKEKQDVKKIFISSIFKREKNYLGIYKFNKLSKFTKKKIIALGGINKNNLKKMHRLNIDGIAAIRLFSG
tara:strand:- start:459 stop:989 length:531 start_codon:yes stop_codon:yes gene_type:complete